MPWTMHGPDVDIDYGKSTNEGYYDFVICSIYKRNFP